jgi:hypothetical protein
MIQEEVKDKGSYQRQKEKYPCIELSNPFHA